MSSFRHFALALIILLVAAALTYLLIPPQTPLSPLGTFVNTNSQLDTNKYVILGFAPYWNLKKITPESLATITHFAYFALHLNGDGSLYTHVVRGEEDPGYTNYKRLLATPPSSNMILTFMQADQEALTSILSSESSRTRALSTIAAMVAQSKATGVNIDFEPLGDIPKAQRQNFTAFIRDLRSLLPAPDYSLSISIYPSAASRPRLWDLPNLAPTTDYFVVMSYDYTLPGSTSAGPNSPLRDLSGEFEHHIIKNLSELTSQLDSRKLLLGIPLYGYEWETLSSSRYSPTDSRGVTASLERIESLLQSKALELVWDRNTLTPYGVSTESGTTTQIYFENETSIRLKLELVRASNLGGIALWALGYDRGVTWLWPLLSTL